MVETTIMFNSIDDVKKFASLANTHEYDLDIISGKYLINAKSIMGIFSLDLTKPLKLVAHTDDTSILEEIDSYIYKESK